MADVELKHLVKKFGDVVAVNDMSLTVHDREFLVLVGPSGCGKTSTLRMVAGLEEITAGEVYIGGRLVNNLPPKDRDIAMVFQNYALYPHMTVYDNMAFGLEMRKFPRAEIQKRVQEAAEILGLEALLRRKPRQLSGGERQRVAVGRAIVRHPQVFLFDEPLSNLDAKLRVQMRVELKRLHQRLQATAIYVTHDQVEAMTLGDRIVVMKDGLIQQVGPPLEVYSMPSNTFVAGFIGSPAMNFLDCTVTGAEGDLRLEAPALCIPVPKERAGLLAAYTNRQVTLGIRPEDIKEVPAGSLPGASFEAVVEVKEPLGSEVILDMKVGSNQMVAKVPPVTTIRVQDKIRLSVDQSKIHLFDPRTERVIV